MFMSQKVEKPGELRMKESLIMGMLTSSEVSHEHFPVNNLAL